MKQILEALFFAALIIGAAFFVKHGQSQGWLEDSAERQAGVIMGIILMWFGNNLPKTPKKNCGQCSSSQSFSMRRFAGALLMLAGALHSLAWVFAPIDLANYLAMIAVASALLIIILRSLFTKTFV